MKIAALKTELVAVPRARPITTATLSIRSVGRVLVSREMDAGLVEQGHLFTINSVLLKSFHEMVKGVEHQVVGRNPHYVTGIGASMAFYRYKVNRGLSYG